MVGLAGEANSATTPALQSPFFDVLGSWAEHDVLLLAARNAVHTAPSGAFYPQTPVTRAQVVGMLVRGLGEDKDAATLAKVSPDFRDIASSSYRGLIESAFELGWVDGYPDRTFRPDAPIRRDELAALMVRVLGFKAQAVTGRGPITYQDAGSIAPWARGYVQLATKYGIVTGYSDGTFRPASFTTKAEAATMVVRVLRAKGASYDFAGVLTNVSQAGLTLAVGQENASFPVAPGVTIFRDLTRATLSDLRAGDEAYVILDQSGRAIFIDAFYWDDLGAVVSVDSQNGFIQFLPRLGGGVRAVGVQDDAAIFRNGRRARLADLRPGDRVYLVFTAATGQARIVDAVHQDVAGTVVSASGLRRQMVIRGYDGINRTYSVSATALAYLNGTRVAWASLAVGTPVIAALENGDIVYIEGEQ